MYKIKEIKCYVISWRRGFIRILRHLGKFVGKFVEYFIFGFVYFLEKDFNRSFLRFLGEEWDILNVYFIYGGRKRAKIL